MKVFELLEASLFRQSSTSNLTYGFEFEVIVNDNVFIKEILEDNNIKDFNIQKDNSLSENGIELISPVYNDKNTALKNFSKILEIIRNVDKLYTNEETGLHINIGTWKDISEIDVLKFLIFSNEHQILNKFDRMFNKYSTPIQRNVINYLQNNNESIKDYKNTIKNINSFILKNTLHYDFIDFSKLLNNGYIEIRGFGNNNYEYKEEYIIKMINYISRLAEISSNPELAKEQYIKKLYKLIKGYSNLKGHNKEIVYNIHPILGLTKEEIDYLNDKVFSKEKIVNNTTSNDFLKILKTNVKKYTEDIKLLHELTGKSENIFSNKAIRLLDKVLNNLNNQNNLNKNTFKNIISILEETNQEKTIKIFKKYI